MADNVQIKFGADAGPALSAIAELRRAIRGLMPAMSEFSGGAIRSFSDAMQTLVDLKQVTTQQALGFDLEYTAQLRDQEAQRLQATISSDAAVLDDKIKAFAQLTQLDAEYTNRVIDDQRRMLDQSQRQAEAVARSYEAGFDRLGSSAQRTFNELLTHQTIWAKGSRQLMLQVETFFLGQVENMAARWAASGLASLAGGTVAGAVGGAQETGASGLGAGLMALVGLNQPGGLFGSGLFSGGGTLQATAITANTTALAASTAAIASLTAVLGGAAAIGGIGAAGAVAGGVAGVAAGGAATVGGLFSWLGGLFSFGKGGIVPSAAGGWALPNFTGATPALLHAREMVLPAPISEGLQDMIGHGAAAGQHFHAHFHGPADAPAISRWFRENMRHNAGAIRDMFRQNALTPRSL